MVVEVLDAEVEETKVQEKKKLFKDVVVGGSNKCQKTSLWKGQSVTCPDLTNLQ
jgi:hypothetical protein